MRRLPWLKKKAWYSDRTLAMLAKEKKAAWDEWKLGGRPIAGDLYDKKCAAQKAFKQRLSLCAASVQRRKIQGLDMKFRENKPSRFKLSRKKNAQGSTFMVNGEICSDPDVVLETWSDHFKTLSNSHSGQFPSMAKIQQEYDLLYGRSFENDDSEMLVDTPFTLEETEGVIKNLKSGKAGGLDHLQAEHLKFGGNSLVLWVQQVCNAAVELETIPDVLKLGVVSQFTRAMDATLWTQIAIAELLYLMYCLRSWSSFCLVASEQSYLPLSFPTRTRLAL